MPQVFAAKPIIGVVGGIGSGKSFVAELFGREGCLVIQSDKLVDDAYNYPEVRETLESWWGASVFKADGSINRSAIGSIVFADPAARSQLESLLHPIVARRREELMTAAASRPDIVAFVWDSPLLVETGLHRRCDAVVFVEAPFNLRLARVSANRGWNEVELRRREKLQHPLDKKHEISEYTIVNTADADYARGQVKVVLSRIRGQSA
jgi:dephospho-CoA kinase